MADVHPNRPPKPTDLDAFNAFIDARARAAEQIRAAANDPEEIRARARERVLLRLLIAMVLIIVLGTFAVSIAFVLLTGNSGAAAGQ